MSNKLSDRFKSAWNVFRNKDPTTINTNDIGIGYGIRPDRTRLQTSNERSIVASIYTRIANDVADLDIKHVRLDQNRRFESDIDSGLNKCLTLEANIDQTSAAFKRDIAYSLLDEGSVAIVPIDTSATLSNFNTFDILSMRTGKILEWYPRDVRVQLYNDRTGYREELILPKEKICILENPFYPIMNEPNSTLRRLIRKLNLLDSVDEQSSSGKLNLIIQLPYTFKTPEKMELAKTRKKNIEMQLTNSKYGIAYTDAAERITQLNRPVENNLMKQVEYLTDTFYAQLGVSKEVFNGTADEKTTLKYYNSVISPIISEICLGMTRTFLTKTARTQGQAIMSFRNPFKLTPVEQLAETADKLTRNEILTSNEVRSLIGYKPSDDPAADELRNKNISSGDSTIPFKEDYNYEYREGDDQNGT